MFKWKMMEYTDPVKVFIWKIVEYTDSVFVFETACFSVCSCFLSEVSAAAQHGHTKKALGK